MHYLVPTILSGIGWGIAPLIDRYSLQHLDGLTLISIRSAIVGICGLLLFIILKLLKKNKLHNNNKFNGGNILILSIILAPIIDFGLGTVGYYLALGQAPSSISQITLVSRAVIIIVISILSVYIYRDKINFKMILGIIITLVGLTMVIMCNPNN